MDIDRAFSFVFADEELVKKILIGGMISLIPIVGSIIFTSVYTYLVMAHRTDQVYRRARRVDNPASLPHSLAF